MHESNNVSSIVRPSTLLGGDDGNQYATRLYETEDLAMTPSKIVT